MKAWIVLLSLLGLYSPALAAVQGPFIWGSNNSALYLPTNRPGSGLACLMVDPTGLVSTSNSCGGGGGGSGTVTSVGLSVPNWMTVTGSPVTTSGTLGIAIPSQAQSLFLASPATASGTPQPRHIVATDVPTLNQNSTGSAGSLSTNFTSGLPLVGNGTGVPGYGTKFGTGTQFGMISGALTLNHCLSVGANGLQDSGVPCNQAAGGSYDVQYRALDGSFAGDSAFTFNTVSKSLVVPTITMSLGTNRPLALDANGVTIGWDRSGNTTVLATVSGVTTPNKCLTYDFNGNVIPSSVDCPAPFVGGGVIVITADYTPTSSNVIILGDSTSTINVNLPDATALDGYYLRIKNINTGTILINGFTGQLIDGNATFGENHQYQSIDIVAKAGNWNVL